MSGRKMEAEEAEAFVRSGGTVRDVDGDVWGMVGDDPGLAPDDRSRMGIQYAPFYVESHPVSETRDPMEAFGWGEWITNLGSHRRINSDLNDSYVFQEKEDGEWVRVWGPGMRPWKRVPATLVEEEETVDEINGIMAAIGWGEWASCHGTYFRVNPDSDSEYAFQFRSGDSAWIGTTSAGLGPYARVKVKKTKPAPATLADCVRALPRGRRRRDAWIVALYIREDAPLSRLSADDLAAADWLNNTDGTWRSPNGTVEE